MSLVGEVPSEPAPTLTLSHIGGGRYVHEYWLWGSCWPAQCPSIYCFAALFCWIQCLGGYDGGRIEIRECPEAALAGASLLLQVMRLPLRPLQPLLYDCGSITAIAIYISMSAWWSEFFPSAAAALHWRLFPIEDNCILGLLNWWWSTGPYTASRLLTGLLLVESPWTALHVVYTCSCW